MAEEEASAEEASAEAVLEEEQAAEEAQDHDSEKTAQRIKTIKNTQE